MSQLARVLLRRVRVALVVATSVIVSACQSEPPSVDRTAPSSARPVASTTDNSKSTSGTRSIELQGQIDDVLANSVIAHLLFFDHQRSDQAVTLTIDSPGGEVASSLAIIDAINQVKCPVYTHVDGRAGGMAALIAASGRRGKRTSTRDSVFWVGRARPSQPPADDVAHDAIERMNEEIVAVLAKTTGRTPQLIREAIAAERHFSAADARERGLIDSIVP